MNEKYKEVDKLKKEIQESFELEKGDIRLPSKFLNNNLVKIKNASIKKLDLQILDKHDFLFKDCKFTNEIKFNKVQIKNYLRFQSCTFQNDVSFCNSTFQNDVSFNNSTFQNNVLFYKVKFEKNVRFYKVKFEKKVSFETCKFDDISFSEVDFSGKANFSALQSVCFHAHKNKFNEVANFSESKFKYFSSYNNSFYEKANFSNCQFEKDARFSSNKFLNNYLAVIFQNAKFNEDANFTASIFKGYANFGDCQFAKTANFYGAKFEDIVNLNASFEKLNVVNAEFKTNSKIFSKFIEKQTDKTKAAVDMRASYNNIKDALIQKNNLLDAQEFHKAELYCKEKELKYKIENDVDKKHKFSRFFSRENIDILLLAFYRTTSDHHTNFVKILNFTALVVAYYAAFLFGMEKMFENDFCYNENFYIAPVVIFIFLFFCLFLLFAKNKFCSLVLSAIAYAGVVITLFCEPSAISPLVGIFDGKTAVSKFEEKLYNMQEFEVTEVVKLVSNDDDLSFEDKVNLLIKSKKTLKNELESKILKFKTMCYYEHKILNQIYIYEIREKSLKSIGLIYFLFMILVLFSLQKTARKNSVVPI